MEARLQEVMPLVVPSKRIVLTLTEDEARTLYQVGNWSSKVADVIYDENANICTVLAIKATLHSLYSALANLDFVKYPKFLK